MKRLILILMVVLFATSCTVNSSDNIDINGEDLVYIKDSRTGLCFAATASRKAMTVETTGLGLTCVPCEKVEHLIGK